MPTSSRKNPGWAEAVQLVPILSLAFPFIRAGAVDLEQAGSGFLVAALLTVPVCGLVLARRFLLNPILVGTAVWLWVGAFAFTLPLPEVASWLAETQAFGLFAAALVVGGVATVGSRHGYVACGCAEVESARRASWVLLGANALVLGWAWVFREDVRLGGGLPFIALNVLRRVLCRRLAG